MRDDLHHSFPLDSPWRRVVQAACGASMGWDIQAKLERAAWSQGSDWVETGWGAELKSALSRPQDMFGADPLMAELKSLERRLPSKSAGRALDCASAEVSQGRVGPDLYQRVLRGSNALCAEDGIENAVSRVAMEKGHYQASELRRVLERVLPQCEFGVRPTRKAVPKPTIDEGLRMALEFREQS